MFDNILSGDKRAVSLVIRVPGRAAVVSGQSFSPLDLGSEWPQFGETRGVCWRLSLMLCERKWRVEAVATAAEYEDALAVPSCKPSPAPSSVSVFQQ